MLKEKLEQFWESGKFATSWIISSNNISGTLSNIKSFAEKVMKAGKLPIDNNPDFYILSKEDTKSITVSQVRNLQDFLSTTPAVSEYKFGIIMEAELMNNNSQNCCLKILEEPPKNTFLFLLTSESSNLKATIKSRCHKLNLAKNNLDEISESYNDFINKISTSNISQKINYLKSISLKAKESDWEDFCKNSLRLILSLNKHSLDPNYKLSSQEESFLKLRRSLQNNLHKRLEKIKNLIDDEKKFDLDKKHVGILILECLD